MRGKSRAVSISTYLAIAFVLNCAHQQAAEPLLSDIPPAVWKPLAQTFETQARGIPDDRWKALYAKYLANPSVPVRVVILDAEPEGAAAGRNNHTSGVHGITRALFCPDGFGQNCSSRIGVVPTRPGMAKGTAALPTDDTHHPVFATFEQFNEQLSRALDGFKPGQERLVISIGMAFDALKLPSSDPRGKAILTSLQRASCMGALIVAPSGNPTGSDGPLLPAAFESQPAPTDAECAANFQIKPLAAAVPALALKKAELAAAAGEAKPRYAPLVYAVSGLDGADQRLVLTRHFGMSRLAALGLSVTVPGANGGLDTWPFTGTSAAAAIVAAIGAAVWSVSPEFDAHDVMAAIYNGGVELDGGLVSKRARTDFCLNQPLGPCKEWPVHRAFLCGALAQVLPNENLGCVMQPTDPKYLAKPAPTDPTPNARGGSIPCRVSGCGFEFGPYAAQLPDGALNQPGTIGCPTCSLFPNFSWLTGSINWSGSGAPSLTRVVLYTYDWNWWPNGSPIQIVPTPYMNTVFSNYVTPPYGTYGAIARVSYNIGFNVNADIGVGVYY